MRDKEFVQCFYKNLNRTNIGFSDDFLTEVVDIHKALYPVSLLIFMNTEPFSVVVIKEKQML